MRRLLLKQNHDDSHANHFDVKRTLELLKRKYYWSAMSQDVKKCHVMWLLIILKIAKAVY
jgi:hypothetical protein